MMKIKCKCGNELQLSVVDEEEGNIYNCPNLNCAGQVIIKHNKDFEIE